MGSVSLIDGHIDDDTPRMTYEEAKAWFEEDLKDGKCSDDCPMCNAMELAIEALEKRIPKKPIYEADGYDENGNLIYDCAICPNCENDDFEYGINNWGCEFCPDCGQALDWSDNE